MMHGVRVRNILLEVTAKRLSKMKFRFGERYVAVNIPAAAVVPTVNSIPLA